MTDDTVPDWAKDENDPPAKLWEKKMDQAVDEITEADKKKKKKTETAPPEEDVRKKESEADTESSDDTEDRDSEEESEIENEEESEEEDEDGLVEYDEIDEDSNPDSEDEDEDYDEDEDENEEEEEDESEDESEEEDDDTAPPAKETSALETYVPPENNENESESKESDKDQEGNKEKDEKSEPSESEKGVAAPNDENNGSKPRSRRSFKYSRPKIGEKFKNWLNGTPERPLPVFSMRARFKRWRLIHFHNHVWLRVMSYDKQLQEYTIRENLVPRRELPKTAVHVTNEKNVYFDHLFKLEYEPWKDNGFGAINAYIYMKDTSLEEALLLMWKGSKPVNWRTLAVVGVIVVAAFFYLLYMTQG